MSQNPNYYTISSDASSGRAPGGAPGLFRLVMPQASGHPQQVIHIGPQGVRTVTPTGGMPQVRILERQSSGQFRVVGGTPSGVRLVESPHTITKTVTTDQGDVTQEFHIMGGGSGGGSGAGGPQVIRIPPQSSNTYRIRVVSGDEGDAAQQVYYQPSTPTSTYRTSVESSRTASPDGAGRDPFRFPHRLHLANTGRSSSADNLGGRFVITTSDGSTGSNTLYGTGPRGLTFSISSSGVQPVTATEQPAPLEHRQEQAPGQQQQQQPVVYTTESRDQARRGSSPQVHVIHIKGAGDSRRQQSPSSFDDIVQKKLCSYLLGRSPQYLFRHQPTVQRSTDGGRNEYIVVTRRPQDGRRGSLDSSMSAGIMPGKKIVRTTREEIRNIGDGQTQTIREVSEELVDDDGRSVPVQPDVIPVYSTPAVGSDDVDTWKSTGSNDSGSGSGSADRNIFNRFRFTFDSIGNFGRPDSRENTATKESLRFEDFDDMVGHISQLKAPVLKAAAEQAAGTGDICPYCKSENPDCEYTCHHKCRQLVALDCAGVNADRRNGERVSRNRTETSLSEQQTSLVRFTSPARCCTGKERCSVSFSLGHRVR